MSNIKDFEIENGVLIKYVGEDTTVIIPEGVVELGKFCFKDVKVEEVILSSTVETISGNAFNETPNLQKVVVDNANLTYCSVDGCLYSKDKKRFIHCPNRLAPLYIAEGCEVIEPYAFFQRKVGKIIFPKTLKRFEHSAMCNCYIDADELVIPNIEFDGGEWFNATTLPPRVILEDFNVVPSGAFTCCKFGSMLLPNTLTEIESWAFSECNMKRIYVPKSVERLGENVFTVVSMWEPVVSEEEFYDPTDDCMPYDDYEEQDEEVVEIDNTLPCPVGFLLGVDNEECAAAKYARANNIPYEVVTDVDAFLNAGCSDEKDKTNDMIKEDLF